MRHMSDKILRKPLAVSSWLLVHKPCVWYEFREIEARRSTLACSTQWLYGEGWEPALLKAE